GRIPNVTVTFGISIPGSGVAGAYSVEAFAIEPAIANAVAKMTDSDSRLLMDMAVYPPGRLELAEFRIRFSARKLIVGRAGPNAMLAGRVRSSTFRSLTVWCDNWNRG